MRKESPPIPWAQSCRTTYVACRPASGLIATAFSSTPLGLDNQHEILAINSGPRLGSFMPDTPGSAEMALQIYQDRQAVFVDPVAAVQARRAHLTQKLAELLTLGRTSNVRSAETWRDSGLNPAALSRNGRRKSYRFS